MTSTAVSDARTRRLLPLHRTLFQLGRWQRHPLISVHIATFNRGQLLTERTIPSILGQTYRNFEIVVVGDGCSDDTGERLGGLRDSRIRWENLPQRGVLGSFRMADRLGSQLMQRSLRVLTNFRGARRPPRKRHQPLETVAQ